MLQAGLRATWHVHQARHAREGDSSSSKLPQRGGTSSRSSRSRTDQVVQASCDVAGRSLAPRIPAGKTSGAGRGQLSAVYANIIFTQTRQCAASWSSAHQPNTRRPAWSRQRSAWNRSPASINSWIYTQTTGGSRATQNIHADVAHPTRTAIRHATRHAFTLLVARPPTRPRAHTPSLPRQAAPPPPTPCRCPPAGQCSCPSCPAEWLPAEQGSMRSRERC